MTTPGVRRKSFGIRGDRRMALCRRQSYMRESCAWVRAVLGRVVFYGGLLWFAWWWILAMPGDGRGGRLRRLTLAAGGLRDRLRHDVEVLASQIGERNVPEHAEQLGRAAAFIETSLAGAGY